jgi:uncharacterized UPF0146 family protein
MALSHKVQAHRAPLKEHKGDKYDTDPVAVAALLKCERLPQRIWEPAAGKGNIVIPLRRAGFYVLATDLNERGCPNCINGVDFLLPTPAAYNNADAIVTNPPFSLDEEFVTLALERAPLVIMLLRMNFYEGGTGKRKNAKLRRELLDGGKLARIHVFANRLPMMHREGWTGNKASSGLCFAWFVWERDNIGATVIDRIYWEPMIPDNDPAADPATWLGPDERVAAEMQARNMPVDYGPLFSTTTGTITSDNGEATATHVEGDVDVPQVRQGE